MARFWAAVLGYSIDLGEDGNAKLYPPSGAPADTPTMWLQASAGPKQHKNRNHPDLRPDDGDVDAEVARLVGLGATHTAVGQTDSDPFVVLADPEGNEFCILERDPWAARPAP